MDCQRVSVVGAGLAGCEAAISLARQGIPVDLLEMKPAVFSPAHRLPGPAELVCSNSLKSERPDTAHGLLKEEMRALESPVMDAAAAARVEAGSALAVDREVFSRKMAETIGRYESINYLPGRPVWEPPPGEVILATGPLTHERLAKWLKRRLGDKAELFFYDALAPIVEADSIDRGRVFSASRWGKGGADYLNCPMDREQYQAFVKALTSAPKAPIRDFEPDRFFEGCLPIEEMARRGENTLAYGPLRPVGLSRRAYAVVQLRPENREGSAYNLVGFQTRLTQAAQREVFRLIPGLENANFLRYGAMHRNFYLDAPRALDDWLGLLGEPRVHVCGQMAGVEGYLESAAMGLLLGLLLGLRLRGRQAPFPPPTCALGALYAHLRRPDRERFEPMNIHFGLLPEIDAAHKAQRRQGKLERARRDFSAWLAQIRDLL